MANICSNELYVSGTSENVSAFINANDGNTERGFGNDQADSDITQHVKNASGIETATYSFWSKWTPNFEDVRAASIEHPETVLTLAGVELGNSIAEIRVFKNGEEHFSYQLESSEIERLAGDTFQESPVINELTTFAASVEDDLIATLGEPRGPKL